MCMRFSTASQTARRAREDTACCLPQARTPVAFSVREIPATPLETAPRSFQQRRTFLQSTTISWTGIPQECPPLLERSWRRLERGGRNLPDGKGDGCSYLWQTACGIFPGSAGGLRRSAEAHAHIFRDAVQRLWPPWQLGRLSPGL